MCVRNLDDAHVCLSPHNHIAQAFDEGDCDLVDRDEGTSRQCRVGWTVVQYVMVKVIGQRVFPVPGTTTAPFGHDVEAGTKHVGGRAENYSNDRSSPCFRGKETQGKG
jgi:hypothetical protein